MNRKIILILPIIILLVSSSTVTAAQTSQQAMETMEYQQQSLEHYYDFGENLRILVLYNEHFGLGNGTADSLYRSLSYLTPNIERVNIETEEDLINAMSSEPDIAIYSFDSDHESLIMKSQTQVYDKIPWTEMANHIGMYGGSTQHIFAMGNTAQLLRNTGLLRNVHGPNQQVIDAQHAFIFAMWELSDILAEHPRAAALSNDIQHLSLQYFADNFNNLVANNLNPDNPMGVEDPRTKQERVDKFYADHPASYERVPQEGNYIDEITGREVNGRTGEPVQYDFDLYSQEEFNQLETDSEHDEGLTATNFIISFLPEDSGLRGPVGGIVDELLGFLIEQIGDIIGLSGDTLTDIVNALTAIPQFIGAVSDPSASKLKGFLDTLKPMIPLPQDKLDYFDLLIDALFLLRGSEADILNFIQAAITKVVPDLGGDDSLVTALNTVLQIAPGLFDSLAAGDNFVDVIFSVLNENMIANLIETYITDTDFATYDLVSALPAMISSLKGIINTVAAGDFLPLVTDYLPEIISGLGFSGSIDGTEAGALGLFAGIIMIATGGIDGATIAQLLELLLNDVFGIENQILRVAIDWLMDLVNDELKAPTDFNSFKTLVTNNVTAVLTNAGLVPANYADGIEAVANLLSLVINVKDGFTLDGAATLVEGIQSLLTQFGLTDPDQQDQVTESINAILAVIQVIKDPPNLQDLLTGFLSDGTLPGVIQELITFFMETIGAGAIIQPGMALELNAFNGAQEGIVESISEAISIMLNVIQNSGDNSIEGLMMTLLQAGGFVITQFADVEVGALVELLTGLFGTVIGLTEQPPSAQEVLSLMSTFLGGIDPGVQDTIETIVGFLFQIQSVFTGGFKAVFAKLAEWLGGQVTQLIESVTGSFTDILDDEDWPLLEINIPIGLGDFSLFDINIGLGLKPGFEFNEEVFYGMIFDLVFKGVSIFSGGADAGDVLKTALSFLSIHPIFIAQISLDGFGSGESSFIDFMLSALGLELSFSGSGFFELSLFSFKNGVFNTDDFFKVLAWGFEFTLTLSRTFTLLDFLTGGAGGSLNAIGKYIGLDAISITIGFTVGVEVVKRAATANKPETGSLTVSLTIFFTVSLGINILIAKLILTGTLEITLTLLQDLVEPAPLRIFISIQLIITVTIGFLFWDWDFEFKWSPNGFSPDDPYELTPSSQAEAKEQGAMGADFDNDGLSNEYEESTPGLNPASVDSDGDGLDDKFETQTLKTDPGLADTDLDGIDDNIELDIGTNPLAPDSDFDRLSDYDEVYILGSNPNEMDTDEDLLDDYYEVHHDYNMTDIWITAPEVTYYGVTYNSRTDVLNPDSDFDGLIDGNEGENGIYYGPELYNSTEQPEYVPDPPLFFNGGYTHPLSNDTDKDSYEQDYAGDITPRKKFLRDMSDFTEIHGIEAIFIDPVTGEPETPRVLYTNPTNPDSDGDTGVDADDRKNPPFGFFLNSDGYELALNKPTDPLDGDTDDDGLIDGYEGILRPDGNHTDANNPDTDGDGLNDMVERELGTDGRIVDSDYDGVTDADEFFIFGTNPFLYDTDSDGLSDGEELWTYHSSPHHRDTDGDGLNDYKEVWVYFSDPSDEDSDNDGLTDWEEIKIHYTDPFAQDTDLDGLFDGDEVRGLNYTVVVNGTETVITVFTDPLKWDTDNDSLLTLDQDGEISQSMSDGDEWKLGTRPDRMDTDMDGIQDGWEKWLGKGKIPEFTPLALDPLNPDTDNDTLKDGSELVIANMSTLLYPYIGFYPLTPFNTSAVNNDTDGDFLHDAEEILLGSLPDVVDSDNDTLTDYEEVYIYQTNPAKNDSDGDGLLDPTEINGYYFPVGHPLYDGNATLIFTQPNELDSDGDLLPDYAEIHHYGKDPQNPDQNNDGILDGMEMDSDGDGLQDGEEYFVYNTTLSGEGGGPFQPDSDRDGLFDGQEVYESQTQPGDWDTDDDTYSDGLEVACGTDPNDNSTTLADFEACFDELSRLLVLSPVIGKTYQTNAIPVIVYDSDFEMNAMEFSYKYGVNLTQTSLTTTMVQDTDRGPGYWKAPEGFSFALTNGSYELEIRADRNDGEVVTRTINFKIQTNPSQLDIITPLNGRTYHFNVINQTSLELPIEVKAGSNYNSLWFTMYDSEGTALTTNQSLNYQGGRDSYFLPTYEFPNTDGVVDYYLIVYANQSNGQVVAVSSQFSIDTPTPLETALTIAAPVVGAAVVVTVVRRAGFKNPFKKGDN